ncbi:MAG: phosphate ABC transporter permease PstA [Cyanobacteria bacterium P01_A01_bin.3]
MTGLPQGLDGNIAGSELFAPNLERRHLVGKIFSTLCLIGTSLGLILLAVLLSRTFVQATTHLNWGFISSYPSQMNPSAAGIRSPLLGSLCILVYTILFSVPVGVGAAVYLEEYAPQNRFTKLLELNIANLAGVPSVVYGILGLGLFVRLMGLGRVVLAGSLTMALVILPVIIVAAREAIRAVPKSLREASYGLGATKWQTVWNHVLPNAIPGILTGVIIAVSRAIGDSASLLIIGALTFITFDPKFLEWGGLTSQFTVLPLQIFFWIGLPQEAFKELAASGIIVLMVLLLSLNAIAIIIRNKYSHLN